MNLLPSFLNLEFSSIHNLTNVVGGAIFIILSERQKKQLILQPELLVPSKVLEPVSTFWGLTTTLTLVADWLWLQIGLGERAYRAWAEGL